MRDGWKRRGFWGDCHGFCKLGFEILIETKGVCREREISLGFEMKIQDFRGFKVSGELGENPKVWDERKMEGYGV